MLSAIAFVHSRVCVCYESMNNSVVLTMHAFDLCSAFEVCLCICFRILDGVFFVCFSECFICLFVAFARCVVIFLLYVAEPMEEGGAVK